MRTRVPLPLPSRSPNAHGAWQAALRRVATRHPRLKPSGHIAAAGETAMDVDLPHGHWHVAVHASIAMLKPEWRRLETQGHCTVFQTFDWLAAWYEVTSRHGAAEPVIVTARRVGSEETEVILPLCRIRRRGYWEVTFADLAVSDFVAPVFIPEAFERPGAMAALMKAVAAALPRCDVIRLEKIPATLGARCNPLLELRDVVPFPVGLWGVPLSVSQMARPQRAKRRVFKNAERRRCELSKCFKREFEWSEGPESVREAFEELVALRIARFEALRRAEILKEPMWRDFYQTLAERHWESLRVVVARIKADGQTIAALFGVGHGSRFHYLVSGFAMEGWEHYVPGLQMIFDLMQECPSRGFDYLDLTIGDERYKKDVGAERRALYETRVPTSLKGRAVCLAWRQRVALRAYPRLIALLRRLASPLTGEQKC